MNVFSYSNVENNSVCNLPGFIERKAFDFGQETEILMLEWAAFNLYDDRTRLLSTEYKASNERSVIHYQAIQFLIGECFFLEGNLKGLRVSVIYM